MLSCPAARLSEMSGSPLMYLVDRVLSHGGQARRTALRRGFDKIYGEGQEAIQRILVHPLNPRPLGAAGVRGVGVVDGGREDASAGVPTAAPAILAQQGQQISDVDGAVSIRVVGPGAPVLPEEAEEVSHVDDPVTVAVGRALRGRAAEQGCHHKQGARSSSSMICR